MPSSPAQQEECRAPRRAKKLGFHISAYGAESVAASRGGAFRGYTTDIGPRGVGFVLARGQGEELLELRRGDGPLRLVFDGLDGRIEVHAALAHARPTAGPGGEVAAGARIVAVSDTEGFRLLAGAPDEPRPSRACLDELFDAQAEATPDAVAVTAEGKSLSFRQLSARVNALAGLLRSRGVGPGTLAGVFVERSPEMLVGLLAVLKAGGAYVPLDPTLPHERLAFMIEDTRMAVVLTQEKLSGALPGGSGAEVILLDGGRGDDPAGGRQVAGGEAHRRNPCDLAYVIYTSGSTGRPKGVMVTHGSVANYVAWMGEAFPTAAGDAVLQKAPFTFDASVWEIFLPLLTGARLVLARHGGERDPGYIADLVAREGVTDVQFVPSLLRPFLETPGVERCLSLRRVFSGGEALPIALQNRFFERLPHAPLYNLYGPTETTVYSAYHFCRPGDDGGAALVNLGRPIRETRLHLLGPDLAPVGGSEPGEIYIAGAGLARGYLNRPELTAERFVPDPFSAEPGARLYRTGDLARETPGGGLEYLGRADQQVKVHGVRVEPGEIEAALGLHRSVRESVVTAREFADGDKKLVAYVVSKAGPAPSVGELRAHLRSSLPDYMVPSAFVALAELPLTYNGKVDLRALPAPDGGRPDLAEPPLAPRDDAEQELRLIWEEVLGVSPVGVRDDFFELGGDSLSAAHMLTLVGERFGRTLTPSALMPAATIEGLARRLTAPAEERDSLLVAFQTGGAEPPLFFVHGLGGEVYGYRALASHLGTDRPVYALRARGLDDSLPPYETVEEMAAAYVKEVLAVRPHGPYFLGGYSSGGLIAYEVAGQLLAAGHEVAYLAVLDETAPPGGKDAPALTEALHFTRNLPYWLIDFVWERSPSAVAADVKRRVKFSTKKAFGPAFRLAGRAAPDVGVADELTLPELPDQRLRFLEVQHRALKAYRPHLRPLFVTLYRSRSQSVFGSPLFDKGWGLLGCRSVNVRVVPGNHKTICDEPHARHLAAAIKEDMQAAAAPPRGR